MPRNPITTNSFNAVAPGQAATLDLPVGDLVYHELLIEYGTSTVGGATEVNMEAEITEVRIKLDGKVQRVFNAAQLFDINRINGIAFAAGFLPIFFSEPWRRTADGEDALGWGTADISTFTVEIDIDGAALNPTLDARIIVDRVRRNNGPIVKWRRHTVPVTAVGLVNVTTLPRQDAYYRLHSFSVNIDDVEVTVDQAEEFKLTDGQMRELYTQHGLAVPLALTSIIFDYTQRIADALPMATRLSNGRARAVSEFRVDFNMNAANTFTLLTETLGPRD